MSKMEIIAILLWGGMRDEWVLVHMRPSVHLASIAQQDLDSHLSFGQVLCAVSSKHNHMGHPHNHPKRHKATYEQQNQGSTALRTTVASSGKQGPIQNGVVRGSRPKHQALPSPHPNWDRTCQISHLNVFAYGEPLLEASPSGTKTKLASKTKSTLPLEPQEEKAPTPQSWAVGPCSHPRNHLNFFFKEGAHIGLVVKLLFYRTRSKNTRLSPQN